MLPSPRGTTPCRAAGGRGAGCGQQGVGCDHSKDLTQSQTEEHSSHNYGCSRQWDTPTTSTARHNPARRSRFCHCPDGPRKGRWATQTDLGAVPLLPPGGDRTSFLISNLGLIRPPGRQWVTTPWPEMGGRMLTWGKSPHPLALWEGDRTWHLLQHLAAFQPQPLPASMPEPQW